MSVPSEEHLKKLGQSLREIDAAMLNRDTDEGPVRWFLGEAGTEITAWVDASGAPHHIQLVFARVSVEWTARGLVTGAFETKGSTAGGRYDPYLLRVGAGVDPAVCKAAVVLLQASDLDPVIAGPLLDGLRAASGPPG